MNAAASQAAETPIYSSSSLGGMTYSLECALDDLSDQIGLLEAAMAPVLLSATECKESGAPMTMRPEYAPAVERIADLCQRAVYLTGKVALIRGNLALT